MTTLPISCPQCPSRTITIAANGAAASSKEWSRRGCEWFLQRTQETAGLGCRRRCRERGGGRDSGQPARRRRACLVMSRRQRQRERGGTGLLSNLLAVAVAVTAAWGAGPGTFPLSPLISSLSHLLSLGCLMAPLVGVGAWWWDGHAKTRKNSRRRTRKAARRRLPSSVAARQPVGWGMRPWV